jgi:kynurenine formamidase
MTHGDVTAPATGNWGRFGVDDERGTLNFLTPEVVLEATRVCRTGKVYNLGLPVQRRDGPVYEHRGAPQRLTLSSQTDRDMYVAFGAEAGVGANEDVLVIPTHNGTHMDALCHVFADEQFYNGYDAGEFASASGAPRCGVEKSGGFAGRAVLLDVARHQGVEWLPPGHKISADDLEACRAAQDVELRRGDVLLVRTGWLDLFPTLKPGEATAVGEPGLDASTVAFVRDHDLAAVGADNGAVECIPFDGQFLVVHIELLVKSGVTLLEHLRLSPMAADGCHEALLVVAPLLVTGATGSPVNPIAIG